MPHGVGPTGPLDAELEKLRRYEPVLRDGGLRGGWVTMAHDVRGRYVALADVVALLAVPPEGERPQETTAETAYREPVEKLARRTAAQVFATPDEQLKPERWWEVYDWCRDIQKLAQQVSERVDEFANAIPDPPKTAEGAQGWQPIEKTRERVDACIRRMPESIRAELRMRENYERLRALADPPAREET